MLISSVEDSMTVTIQSNMIKVAYGIPYDPQIYSGGGRNTNLTNYGKKITGRTFNEINLNNQF